MTESSTLTGILAINAGSLITVITVGVKILRIFNRMELKMQMLWSDYHQRRGIVVESEL